MPSMNSFAVPLLAAVLLARLLFSSRFYWAKFFRRIPYPPGPHPFSSFSSKKLLQRLLGGRIPWKDVVDKAPEYREMLHISILGTHILVINSLQIAQDLLEKRSAIYSNRPQHMVMAVTTGFDNIVPAAPYGPNWKERRRLIHQNISKNTMAQFSSVVEANVRKTLKSILDSPDSLDDDLRLGVTRTLLQVTYGLKIEDPFHEYVLGNETAFKDFNRSAFGRYAVDLLPFLRFIPSWVPQLGASQKVSARLRKARELIVHRPLKYVMSQLEANEALDPSIASLLIASGKYSHENIQYACGSASIAGIDPPLVAIRAVLLAMLMHPEIQSNVHKEIDALLGTGPNGILTRLPEAEDRARLPYLDAVIHEAYRWHIPAPFAIPHASVEEDIYRGYLIPKGTVVIPNLWAICHDEALYPNPDEFRPERFLGEDPAISPTNIVFGFGKRACVGMDFAENLVFSICASVLACFSIAPSLDKTGAPVPPDLKPGHSSILQPYACEVCVRSPEIQEMIRGGCT